MALDPNRDARRMRIGLLLAGLGLAAAMAVAAVSALSPAWRSLQVEAGAEPGIRQRIDCAGLVDRCATCHLAAAGPGRDDPDTPQPHRAHPPRPACQSGPDLGCGACHGGTPRALDAAVAHGLPGGNGPDPLMKAPQVQAACGRCHVPGAVAGSEHLARGAMRFLQLGCPVCHPLTPGGKGGAAFGPDLRSSGRRSLKYLTDSLMDPAANFAGSDMPSFRRTLTEHPEVLTDLLVFLQSLALAPLPACAPPGGAGRLVGRPCADCHAGPDGRASGRMKHTCTYIRERSASLACGGCHPGEPPKPGIGNGFCPVVRQHRPACIACHPAQASGD